MRFNKLSPLIRGQIPNYIYHLIGEDDTSIVSLLEEYYKWMEQGGEPILQSYQDIPISLVQRDTFITLGKENFNTYAALANLKNVRDIDTTNISYIDSFISEYFADFPLDTLQNIKNSQKFIKNFYENKGNENSFEFLFRMIFEKDIEIEYPIEKVVVPSGGSYKTRNRIRVEINENIPIDDYIGRKVITDSSSGVIDSYYQDTIYSNDKKHSKNIWQIELIEIEIDTDKVKALMNAAGISYTEETDFKRYAFLDGDSITVLLDDQTTTLQCLRGIIELSGSTSNWYPDQKVVVGNDSPQGNWFGGSFSVAEVEDLEIVEYENITNISNAYFINTFYQIYDREIPLTSGVMVGTESGATADFIYDDGRLWVENIKGSFLSDEENQEDFSSEIINVNDVLAFRLKSKHEACRVSALSDSTGLLYGGKGYNFNPYVYSLDSSGDKVKSTVYGLGKVKKFKVDNMGFHPNNNGISITFSGVDGNFSPYYGYMHTEDYIENNGKLLGSGAVLRDSQYYQEFSYQINSDIDISKWKDIVEKVLHPAGMIYYSGLDVYGNSNSPPFEISLTPNVIDTQIPVTYELVLPLYQPEYTDDWYSNSIDQHSNISLTYSINNGSISTSTVFFSADEASRSFFLDCDIDNISITDTNFTTKVENHSNNSISYDINSFTVTDTYFYSLSSQHISTDVSILVDNFISYIDNYSFYHIPETKEYTSSITCFIPEISYDSSGTEVEKIPQEHEFVPTIDPVPFPPIESFSGSFTLLVQNKTHTKNTISYIPQITSDSSGTEVEKIPQEHEFVPTIDPVPFPPITDHYDSNIPKRVPQFLNHPIPTIVTTTPSYSSSQEIDIIDASIPHEIEVEGSFDSIIDYQYDQYGNIIMTTVDANTENQSFRRPPQDVGQGNFMMGADDDSVVPLYGSQPTKHILSTQYSGLDLDSDSLSGERSKSWIIENTFSDLNASLTMSGDLDKVFIAITESSSLDFSILSRSSTFQRNLNEFVELTSNFEFNYFDKTTTFNRIINENTHIIETQSSWGSVTEELTGVYEDIPNNIDRSVTVNSGISLQISNRDVDFSTVSHQNPIVGEGWTASDYFTRNWSQASDTINLKTWVNSSGLPFLKAKNLNHSTHGTQIRITDIKVGNDPRPDAISGNAVSYWSNNFNVTFPLYDVDGEALIMPETVSFNVQIRDGNQYSNVYTSALVIGNQAPTIPANSFDTEIVVNEGGNQLISLVANDENINDCIWSISTPPTYGSLGTITTNDQGVNQIIYTAHSDIYSDKINPSTNSAYGNDSFSYKVTDQQGEFVIQDVEIRIENVLDAPVFTEYPESSLQPVEDTEELFVIAAESPDDGVSVTYSYEITFDPTSPNPTIESAFHFGGIVSDTGNYWKWNPTLNDGEHKNGYAGHVRFKATSGQGDSARTAVGSWFSVDVTAVNDLISLNGFGDINWPDTWENYYEGELVEINLTARTTQHDTDETLTYAITNPMGSGSIAWRWTGYSGSGGSIIHQGLRTNVDANLFASIDDTDPNEVKLVVDFSDDYWTANPQFTLDIGDIRYLLLKVQVTTSSSDISAANFIFAIHGDDVLPSWAEEDLDNYYEDLFTGTIMDSDNSSVNGYTGKYYAPRNPSSVVDIYDKMSNSFIPDLNPYYQEMGKYYVEILAEDVDSLVIWRDSGTGTLVYSIQVEEQDEKFLTLSNKTSTQAGWDYYYVSDTLSFGNEDYNITLYSPLLNPYSNNDPMGDRPIDNRAFLEVVTPNYINSIKNFSVKIKAYSGGVGDNFPITQTIIFKATDHNELPVLVSSAWPADLMSIIDLSQAPDDDFTYNFTTNEFYWYTSSSSNNYLTFSYPQDEENDTISFEGLVIDGDTEIAGYDPELGAWVGEWGTFTHDNNILTYVPTGDIIYNATQETGAGYVDETFKLRFTDDKHETYITQIFYFRIYPPNVPPVSYDINDPDKFGVIEVTNKAQNDAASGVLIDFNSHSNYGIGIDGSWNFATDENDDDAAGVAAAVNSRMAITSLPTDEDGNVSGALVVWSMSSWSGFNTGISTTYLYTYGETDILSYNYPSSAITEPFSTMPTTVLLDNTRMAQGNSIYSFHYYTIPPYYLGQSIESIYNWRTHYTELPEQTNYPQHPVAEDRYYLFHHDGSIVGNTSVSRHQLMYIPNKDYTGEISFTYDVLDSHEHWSSNGPQTCNITVLPYNERPELPSGPSYYVHVDNQPVIFGEYESYIWDLNGTATDAEDDAAGIPLTYEVYAPSASDTESPLESIDTGQGAIEGAYPHFGLKVDPLLDDNGEEVKNKFVVSFDHTNYGDMGPNNAGINANSDYVAKKNYVDSISVDNSAPYNSFRSGWGYVWVRVKDSQGEYNMFNAEERWEHYWFGVYPQNSDSTMVFFDQDSQDLHNSGSPLDINQYTSGNERGSYFTIDESSTGNDEYTGTFVASHADGTYKFWIQESVETNGVITDQQTLLHKEYGTWEITHQTNGTWKFKPAANFFGMTPSVTIRAEHGSNSGIWQDIEISYFVKPVESNMTHVSSQTIATDAHDAWAYPLYDESGNITGWDTDSGTTNGYNVSEGSVAIDLRKLITWHDGDNNLITTHISVENSTNISTPHTSSIPLTGTVPTENEDIRGYHVITFDDSDEDYTASINYYATYSGDLPSVTNELKNENDPQRTITLNVNQNTSTNAGGNATVSFSVIGVDEPPYWSSVGASSITMNEDQVTIVGTWTLADDDDDTLPTISGTFKDVHGNIRGDVSYGNQYDQNNNLLGNITITPNTNFNGNAILTVSASGTQGPDDSIHNISVTDTNDPPNISGLFSSPSNHSSYQLPNLTAGAQYEITLTATDDFTAENELQWSVVGGGINTYNVSAVSNGNGSFTVTNGTDVGDFANLKISCSDGSLATHRNISGIITNSAPSIENGSIGDVQSGDSINVEVTGSDLTDGGLTVQVLDPANFGGNPTVGGFITGSPEISAPNAQGKQFLTGTVVDWVNEDIPIFVWLVVTDEDGSQTTKKLEGQVIQQANQAPVVTQPDDYGSNAFYGGEAIFPNPLSTESTKHYGGYYTEADGVGSITVSATDPDHTGAQGESLEVVLSAGYENLDISSSLTWADGMTIYHFPVPNNSGTYSATTEVKFKVKDEDGALSDEITVNFDVDGVDYLAPALDNSITLDSWGTNRFVIDLHSENNPTSFEFDFKGELERQLEGEMSSFDNLEWMITEAKGTGMGISTSNLNTWLTASQATGYLNNAKSLSNSQIGQILSDFDGDPYFKIKCRDSQGRTSGICTFKTYYNPTGINSNSARWSVAPNGSYHPIYSLVYLDYSWNTTTLRGAGTQLNHHSPEFMHAGQTTSTISIGGTISASSGGGTSFGYQITFDHPNNRCVLQGTGNGFPTDGDWWTHTETHQIIAEDEFGFEYTDNFSVTFQNYKNLLETTYSDESWWDTNTNTQLLPDILAADVLPWTWSSWCSFWNARLSPVIALNSGLNADGDNDFDDNDIQTFLFDSRYNSSW